MNDSTKELIEKIEESHIDLLADAAVYLFEEGKITLEEYNDLGRWYWTQQGEHFICQKCNTVVLKRDYDYKEGRMFESLKNDQKCEQCARGE